MTDTLTPILGEATIQELREAVRGEVLAAGDDGYDEAHRIWNGEHDGSTPALVARCVGTADVIPAVGFARANDLPIAVRGGGHSVAGFSTCDDGVMIDLSPMNHVHVDPVGRRATVGGGAIWADVDHETQAHGLATTGGLVSTTGVAGFTLGGGIGWAMRSFGLACDNLAAADVVTADGGLVRASGSQNSDLLWGSGAAAATSGSSRSSSSTSTRWARSSTAGRSSIRRRRPAISCARSACGRPRHRTRSRRWWISRRRRRCRSFRRRGMARRSPR